jgi:flagellar biosynthesis protein FlhA
LALNKPDTRLSNIKLFKNSDIILAVAAISVIAMMIIPIPPFLLDLLLVFDIGFALVILLTSMFTLEPLNFSSFPGLLLVITLFRLALEVSSTRLVLLHAYAGKVIQAFGNFVVGGNYVVGFVIFLILIIIQFVVVTSGATRVAEVAARFTLDAMPGKQMAIDADLNSGLINEEEARRRRSEIEREADFYGAMDGASKFIRGDVIAAILILAINIIGGLIVGMVQKGMGLIEALHTYTLLTIGEGIVTEMPSLFASVATGFIVTRAASQKNLGEEITTQMFSSPRALIIVTLTLAVFALIPGLPLIPFAAMAVGAYLIYRVVNQALKAPAAAPAVEEKPKEPESVVPLLQLDPMELEIGYGLIQLVDTGEGGDLLGRLTMIRRQTALDLGIIVPPIRVRDNVQLKPSSYRVKFFGLEVAKGEVMTGRYLAMDPGTVTEEIEGIKTKEPTFGLPAVWIAESQKSRAEVLGYTVIDPGTVVTTHVSEIIHSHAADLLGRQEVQTLLNNLKTTYPVVVEELIPNLLTIGELQKVLQNLVREKISIRNLLLILETLADQTRISRDVEFLTEKVRQALSTSICREYLQQDGTLPVLTLDPALENMMGEVVKKGQKEMLGALHPDTLRSFYGSLLKQVENMTKQGYSPVLLCSQAIRPYFRHLVERVIPNLVVLSYHEIVPEASIKAVGSVSLEGEKVKL